MKKKAKKKERVIFNPTGKIIRDGTIGPHSERSGKYAHCCYEWDELLIDETDKEFQACLCGVPDPLT